MSLKGQITLDELNIIEVTADPSTGGNGVIAPIGSIALLNDGITRGFWQKFGLGDTDWEPMTVIPQYTVDPVSPPAHSAWMLRTEVAGSPIGLLLALTHGANGYKLSYKTNEGIVVRTKMT